MLAAGTEGRAVDKWEDLKRVLVDAGGQDVPMKLRRGTETVSVVLKPKLLERLTLDGAAGEPQFISLPRILNPVDAAERGAVQTVRWFGRVYMNLKQMMTGQIGTETVGGPVLIAQVAVSEASRGTGTLLDFLGMITVSIAVLNFLPVPPFDGGHVLFVLIESVRRRPVSLKARTAVWIVGWAVVGLVFLAVTYRDIFRWLNS